MSTYNFSLFADYFQFYIQDENSPGISGESWSREASDRCLAVEEAAIAVGTSRNMEVPVHIEFLDSAPGDDSESWDRVNECSIVITSGRLVVAGCTDYFPDASRIEVEAGVYRARICYGGLDTLSADGLEGNDHYSIFLWLAPAVDGVFEIKQSNLRGG